MRPSPFAASKSTAQEYRRFLCRLHLVHALAVAGLKPRKVDSRALALTRGVAVASGAILNVEARGADVIVVSDFVPMVVSRRELGLGMDINDIAEDITDELRCSLEYYGDRYPAAPLPANAPVYLTGGHPMLDSGLASKLADSVSQPLLFPEPELSYPGDFPVLGFMVNVGLALKAA